MNYFNKKRYVNNVFVDCGYAIKLYSLYKYTFIFNSEILTMYMGKYIHTQICISKFQ